MKDLAYTGSYSNHSTKRKREFFLLSTVALDFWVHVHVGINLATRCSSSLVLISLLHDTLLYKCDNN